MSKKLLLLIALIMLLTSSIWATITQTAPANAAVAQSVIPVFSWTVDAGEADFTLTISTNNDLSSPIYTAAHTSGDPLPLLTMALNYSTTYYWQVVASTNPTAPSVSSFTTKTLTLTTPTYSYSTDSGSTWIPLVATTPISAGATHQIRYSVITNETQDLSTAASNVSMTALSSVSAPARPAIALNFAAPDADVGGLTAAGTESIITKTYTLISTGNPTSSEILFGNNETLTLNSIDNTPLVLHTPITAIVTMSGLGTSSVGYNDDNTLPEETSAANLYFRFKSSGSPNYYEKIIIKNINTGTELIGYAYANGSNNEITITNTTINTLARLNYADRIAVYSFLQPTIRKDFIWLGNTPPTTPTTAAFNPLLITSDQTSEITTTGSRWVRVYSTQDPVGFVTQGSVLNKTMVNIGTVTIPATNTIFAENGDFVYASTLAGVAFDPPLTVSDATTITLPAAGINNPNLNTTTSNLPTFTWTETAAVVPDAYRLVISKNISMSNPVYDATHASGAALPAGYALDYNTVYYWRIYPFNNTREAAGEPSAIGSFTTPKTSVIPNLSWSAITGSGNYFIQVSKNADYSTPVIDYTDTGADLAYQIPGANALEYNTTYYWRVRRGAAGTVVAQNNFTTKALNLISETYDKAPNSTIDVTNTIVYTAVTDEFEDLSAAQSNVSITALSSISDPVRTAIALNFSVPVGVQSNVTRTFTVIAAGPAVTPTASQIKITNNELVTMKFLYGNNIMFNTPTPAQVTITSLASSDVALGGAALGNQTDDTTAPADNGLFFRFVTAGAPNNSEKIILKNLNTGTMHVKYAYSTGVNYDINITNTELDSIAVAGQSNRLAVYSFNQPTIRKDFIWLADGTLPASATNAVFNPLSITPTQTAEITTTGSRWVRVFSSLDPVGFVVEGSTTNKVTIHIGLTTDPTTNTIEAGIGGTVSAATLPGVVLGTPLNIISETYQVFNMVTPTNLSTTVDIYPNLSWTSAFSNRSANDVTRYQITISENADLSSPVQQWITTATSAYPPVDLQFSKTYYWKVVVLPNGANATPANLGNMGAWNFTTIAATNYVINNTIPADRTLNVLNTPYKMTLAPATANNTTLKIQAGTQLQFAANTKLVIGGNLEIVGTHVNRTTFTRLTAGTTWNGIEVKHDAAISRNALVVNENNTYQSGNYLKKIKIEYTTKPLSYQTGALADFYIDDALLENNENGLEISNNSYIKASTLQNFATSTQTGRYGIKGGAYFDDVIIKGVSTASPYGGYGILTSNKNAIIKNSTFKFLTGNAIENNSAALDGVMIVDNNIIQLNTGIAVKAIKGSRITRNTIGGFDTTDPLPANHFTLGNGGSAIINGAYIASNNIQRNGANAILADAGATVINNIITNNPGYGIVNGKAIANNSIVNQNSIADALRNKDAIKADDDATVSGNTITNNKGYGINGGKIIFHNTISITDDTITGSATANYAITAKSAVVASTVEANVITNPIGFGILNGRNIVGNTITSGTSTLTSGAYGIMAEIGSTVKNNTITGMSGTAIEKGILIHNNTITNVKDCIKADVDATITNNVISNNSSTVSGLAISGGKIINFNTIKGVNSGTADLISSALLEEFKNNIIGTANVGENNQATGATGSILSAIKTATTSLVITNNTFTNNRYKNNTLRISSKNLTISNNTITNNFDSSTALLEAATGGLITPAASQTGAGAAIYIKLSDSLAVFSGNTITGHKGNKEGAALYIEATTPLTDKITINNNNIFSDNHARTTDAKGGAIYHKNGRVVLDYNTITNNSTLNNILPSGSAIYTETNGLVSPATNGYLVITNNIIAGNAGKWAVYGTPKQMQYNNIYDNTADGLAVNWNIIPPATTPANPAMNLYYTNSTNHLLMTNNFWGTRSSIEEIDPSLFDNDESVSLGLINYQPILSGPSITTPGIVSNIAFVMTTDAFDNALIDLDDLTIATPYYVTVKAADNNDYSADFTEVTILNNRTNQYIQPLLQETGINSDIYKALFTLSPDISAYNPATFVLPVQTGDQLVITSLTNGSITNTETVLIATGSIATYPNITTYDFGTWVTAATPTKTFTFTNTGAIPLTLNAVPATVTGAPFAVTQMPAASTIVPPGGSFEVVVTYTAPAAASNADALVINFDTGVAAYDKSIALNATSVGAWVDPFDRWGMASPLSNQMTVISSVTIDGTPAPADTRIAAFVADGATEVLRGNTTITGNTGLATIVIQTSTANERIYFKVWDPTNHVLYDCDYAINSVPGATVTSRTVPIPAKTKYAVSGDINTSLAADLPLVLVKNIETDAEVNPVTNTVFEYTTEADGTYYFEVFKNSAVTIQPTLAGYDFAPLSITINNIAAATPAQDFVGTLKTYLISGTVKFGNGSLPLANVDVFGGYKTDANGNYSFVVDYNTAVSLSVDLSSLGLTPTPFNVDLGNVTMDYVNTDETNINDADGVKRTQTIVLTTGWNLISLNTTPADPAPSAIFAAVGANGGLTVPANLSEVRTPTEVYTSASPGTATLTEIVTGKGYYVLCTGATTLTVIGNVADQAVEIPLETGWNLAGYTMSGTGQTRIMVNNNPDVTQISGLSASYFYDDNPVGASNLYSLSANNGYWMNVGDPLVDDEFDGFAYNPNYDNLVSQFEIGYTAGTNDMLSTADVYGVITNTNRGTYDAPKTIAISLPSNQADLALTPNLELSSAFTPGLVKAFTAAEYAVLNGATATWSSVLDYVANAANGSVVTGTAPNFGEVNYTFTAGAATYFAFVNNDLSTDVLKQHAEMIWYAVTPTLAANTAMDLTAFAIESDGDLYRGILNTTPATDLYTVYVPFGTDLTNVTLHFASNGEGLYDAIGGVAGAGAKLVSGTTTKTFVSKALNHYSVEDVNVATGAGHFTDFDIRVVELPANASNVFFADNNNQTLKYSLAPKNERPVDIFGKVKILTNSHYVLGKITANGASVNPNIYIAAYVNGELRGKQKVITYQNQTYMPILINTVNENETVNFKYWLEGQEIHTLVQTLQTIPGGTTGSMSNLYAFNISALGTDNPEPIFINELSNAYPNPFNPTTTIEFSLKNKQEASLVVYNIKGQKVKTLTKGMMDAGRHKIVWNGKNDSGQSVASGIYFYRFDTKGYHNVKKALLLK